MIIETVEECPSCKGWGSGSVWGGRCSTCDGDGAVKVLKGVPNGRVEQVPFSHARR